MNTDASSPNFELPAPQTTGETDSSVSKKELAAARPEASPIPSVPPAQPVLPPPPHPIFNQSSKTNSSSTPSNPHTAQLQAEDTDLIEKEWVQKAKQILQATKEDPYTQNKEFSKIKADYLKKRYNKDLKTEES